MVLGRRDDVADLVRAGRSCYGKGEDEAGGYGVLSHHDGGSGRFPSEMHWLGREHYTADVGHIRGVCAKKVWGSWSLRG